MPLEDIMTTIGETLLVLRPNVSFAGPRGKDDTSRPGRVTWSLEGDGAINPPKGLGGGPGKDGAIMSRTWPIVVEIWSADMDVAEDLVNTVLGAIHRCLTAESYEIAKETWDTGGRTSKGITCKVLLGLKVPVPRLTSEVKVITAINTDIHLEESGA